ncbi:hypothetical protein NIE79_003028 [Micromonospora sp. NIE79]|uniref:AraC family transcriptional regulator n=1 Tax=Micromonospora trifolii TaxID=2911208 RepID=A0ABS9N4J4_9ACTN|nr:hypothetical protein [Micromonospora trifolii]MCG5444867.1 hypothetical protein [Micromonospora trifolii]
MSERSERTSQHSSGALRAAAERSEVVAGSERSERTSQHSSGALRAAAERSEVTA